MSLAELGELLRQSREARNLSVDEIASILKINPRLIRNIESGNHAALPHAVYVRGFIKTYAKMLDIEPDAVESGLLEFAPAESEVSAQVVAAPPRAKHGFGLKVLVTLCVLAFAGYWFVTSRGLSFTDFTLEGLGQQLHALRPENRVPATRAPALPAFVGQIEEEQPVSVNNQSVVPPAVSAGEQGLQTNPAIVPDAPDAADQPDQSDARGLSPSSADSAAGTVSTEPLPEDVQTRVSGFAPPQQALPEHGDGAGAVTTVGFRADASRRIILSGMKEGFIDFEADGSDARRHMVVPGEIFSLSFHSALRLTVSDPSAIMMRVDDRMSPLRGRAGSPLTLVFPMQQEVF